MVMMMMTLEHFPQVNFSEPLSFLQRLTEDFEYSECLDKAAAAGDDVYEQFAYVAAFTVSSYSTDNHTNSEAVQSAPRRDLRV